LILLSIQDNLNQDVSDLNSRYFIKHYIQLLNELKKREENNQQDKLKLGVSKSPTSIHIATQPAATKQRRSSWIPNLSSSSSSTKK
jgi:hypothetical protein